MRQHTESQHQDADNIVSNNQPEKASTDIPMQTKFEAEKLKKLAI